MADFKISDLTSAGTLDGTEPIEIEQGGNSRKTTLAAAVRSTPASASATGVVELATAAEILSGTAGALAVTPSAIDTALALTTPSGAANFAPDFSVDGVADWNVTANRTLSNPTNVVAGKTRYVFIRSNSGTPRTITFGSNFKGDLPTLDDVTNAKWYLLSLVAYSATHIVVVAVDASP